MYQNCRTTYFFHLCVTLKGQFIVIINIGELALRHVDSAFGNIIDLTLLEDLVKGINLVIEPRSTNLAALVEEIDREKPALTLRIMPSFDF